MPSRTWLLLAVGIALQLVQALPTNSTNVTCSTPHCTQTAEEIKRDMNPQADPCSDFFEYSCGGFIQKMEIPPDRPSQNAFYLINDDLSLYMKSILEGNGTNSTNAPSGDAAVQQNLKKLQDDYNSCMNEQKLTEVGRQPLLNQLQTFLDVFPVEGSDLHVSGNSSESPNGKTEGKEGQTGTLDKTALSKAIAYFTKNGLSSIQTFLVAIDDKNPEKRSLRVSEGGLHLPSKEYYQDAATVGAYEQTVGQMFNLVFGNSSTPGNNTTPSGNETQPSPAGEPWGSVAKSVVEFEVNLANISSNLIDVLNPVNIYNPMTLENISSITPSIDWPGLIDDILPSGEKYNGSFIVTSPKFLKELETLLNQTSPKVLQNYMAWSLIFQTAEYLSTEYRQPVDGFNSLLQGTNSTATPKRSDTCIKAVEKDLGQMSGYYIVKEKFKGDSKKAVEDMVEAMRSEYLKLFPTLTWLDKPVMEKAILKMKMLQKAIGYSTKNPDVTSPTSLQEYYKDYKVDVNDYYGNRLRGSETTFSRTLLQLNQPVDRSEMTLPPSTVNAFYLATSSSINMFAGILQPPFFHYESPDYVNYGGAGMIAAHELTHGFDTRGSLYDEKGSLSNWWDNTTLASFTEKAQCFVRQYGNFTVEGPGGQSYPVNGEVTLAENIADNGGLARAFAAWQTKYNADKSDKGNRNFLLPGLDNLTREQIFFISYARLWCSNDRPELVLTTIRGDTHSPVKWRVNGAVQNTPEFSAAFQCQAGAPMNPDSKCKIW